MPDTPVMVNQATTADAAADRLTAEAIGLLLEPLALDETLTGAEMLEVAGAIAERANGRDRAASAALGEELRRAAESIGVHSQLIQELREASAAAAVPLGDVDARACLNLLEHGASVSRLRALREVPDDALQLRRVDAEYELRTLQQLGAAYAEAETRYLAEAHRSALKLDLDREIKDLRHGGWLFGLISTTSDAARDRVAPHLRGAAARAGSHEMARILDRVKAGKRELERLDRERAARPQWTRWLIPVGSTPSRARARALEWVLRARDGGIFGAPELSLIQNDRVRKFLLTQAAQRVGERTAQPGRRPFDNEEVARLASGLSIPPTAPLDGVLLWREQMEKGSSLLAQAVIAVRLSRRDAALRQAVDAALDSARSPFGPADSSRPELRRLLEEAATAAAAGHVPIPESAHPAIAEVVRDLVQTERALAQALSPRPPLRGPLRVAIAGRTKAGKTTLRKALTRDPDPDGVGRGAHRTTRRLESFGWRGMEFVDTPGVAAYDDDFDAETALAACREADGVLWVYADTLRKEELEYLGALLALGKPVIVVFNAKWRVDDPGRLGIFSRTPHLAFRHFNGHAERVAQVAAQAGARPPQVLPAHVGAAFEALRAGNTPLRRNALAASRLLQVEDALHQLLVLQAQPLRATALVEAVRTPLTFATELIEEALADLPRHNAAAREQVTAERHDLARCTDAAERAALTVLDQEIAKMRANVGVFMRGAADAQDIQRRWRQFVEERPLDAPLATFIDRLNRDTTRAGVLLEREHRLRRAVASEVALDAAPPRSFWRYLRSAAVGVFRRVLTGILGGRGRGLAPARVAGGAARKVPWLGWALLAADAVGGAARGINEEVSQSHIEESRWRHDAHAAVRSEIDRLRAALEARLVEAATSVRAVIESELGAAMEAAVAADEQLRSFREQLPGLHSAIAAVDLVLARRLAGLSGVSAADITRAQRHPGDTFDIWVRPGGQADYDQLLGTIRTCLRERATVNYEAPTPELASVGVRGGRAW